MPMPARASSSRWIAAAVAVVAIAVVAAFFLRRAAPAPFTSSLPVSVAPATLSPSLLALATINPPRYAPSESGGPAPAPGFTDAMRAYAAEDYTAATTRLRLVRLSDRADVQVNFFFGVSLLMSARSIDVPEAIEPFTRVITSGESPYRQLASLYLGKAHIRLGKLAAAEREWERTLTLPGTHAGDARDLLKVLRTEAAAYR